MIHDVIQFNIFIHDLYGDHIAYDNIIYNCGNDSTILSCNLEHDMKIVLN